MGKYESFNCGDNSAKSRLDLHIFNKDYSDGLPNRLALKQVINKDVVVFNSKLYFIAYEDISQTKEVKRTLGVYALMPTFPDSWNSFSWICAIKPVKAKKN